MSTQGKHTPGPWHVGQGNGEGSIFARDGRMRMETGGTTLYPICTVTQGWKAEEDDANANLLAAAPDLLRVAEWLDTLAEHLVIRHDLPAVEWSGLDRSLNSMVAHAKAAIAKARGTAA